MTFKKIDAAVIRSALADTNRQYLAGSLSKPQAVDYLEDHAIEIGISSYSEAAAETSHRHSKAREYQLVLKGMTEYLDLDTRQVHRFVSGDFYAIYPGTSYAQRAKADTDILFVKVPAGNDKEIVHEDEDVRAWMAERLRARRTDFHGEAAAPKPNSLKPAVAVGILDKAGRILLTRRRDSGNWTMPGGTLEIDESIEQCGRREVKEETGLEVIVTGLVGTYTDPGNVVAYSDGEVRREFSVLLAGEVIDGELHVDDESIEINWFPPEGVESLPMANSQQRRVRDFLTFSRTGETFCR